MAAPIQDNDGGSWQDSYSDGTGISSSSNVGFTVDHVQLKNSEGGFTAPYEASGYFITSTIMPQLIGRWGEASYTGDIPAGTSVSVQILDSTNVVYPATFLESNDVGSTDNPFDFSSIPITIFH